MFTFTFPKTVLVVKIYPPENKTHGTRIYAKRKKYRTKPPVFVAPPIVSTCHVTLALESQLRPKKECPSRHAGKPQQGLDDERKVLER